MTLRCLNPKLSNVGSIEVSRGGGAGLPYKNEGSTCRTFQGLKFVDWYRLGWYNISKMTAGKGIAVPFRILSKTCQELCAFPLIFICNFSIVINNCQRKLIWCFRIGFSRRTPGI